MNINWLKPRCMNVKKNFYIHKIFTNREFSRFVASKFREFNGLYRSPWSCCYVKSFLLFNWEDFLKTKDGDKHLSHSITILTKWHVRPAKTQISLGIRPDWSESSLCTQWVAKDPMFLYADSEVYDQTGRMPMLIWVLAGRTGHFVCFVLLRLTYSMPFWESV